MLNALNLRDLQCIQKVHYGMCICYLQLLRKIGWPSAITRLTVHCDQRLHHFADFPCGDKSVCCAFIVNSIFLL